MLCLKKSCWKERKANDEHRTVPYHRTNIKHLDSSSTEISHSFAIFQDLPQNNDSSEPPLMLTYPIAEFFANNPVVAIKSLITAADTITETIYYSRGILLCFSPPEGFSYWLTTAFLTSFSEDKNKNEYLFQIGSKIAIALRKVFGKKKKRKQSKSNFKQN